jgi:hypothetical protein
MTFNSMVEYQFWKVSLFLSSNCMILEHQKGLTCWFGVSLLIMNFHVHL